MRERGPSTVVMPTFLIIGAARAATTSLHYYLDAHPQIAMSTVKEPNFFAFSHDGDAIAPLIAPDDRLEAKSVPERAAYEGLFETTAETLAIGEASPLYLYVREAPAQIAEVLDHPKLIAVVRDPIDRAWSHHAMFHQGAPEDVPATFRAAAETEMAIDGYTPFASGAHLLRLGRYAEQLDRYLEHHDQDHLLVLTFDEVSDSPNEAVAKVCRFLGVDDAVDLGQLTAYNGSHTTTNPVLRALRKGLSKVQPWLKSALPPKVVRPLAQARARLSKPGTGPEIDDDLRAQLQDYFRDDLHRLAERWDLDLRGWPTWTEPSTSTSA